MTFLEESLDMVAGLQEEVYHRVSLVRAGSVSVDELIEYYHYLYAMLEKQQILLTRLQLMKDESVEGIITGIRMVTDAFYRDPEQSLQEWHTMMKMDVLSALEDLTGEIIDPANLELDIHWEE